MKGRILVLLAALLVAAWAWLATRGEERTKRGLAAPRVELDATPGAHAADASLPVPAAREPALEAAASVASDEAEAQPSSARELTRNAPLVTLYQHASHDASFPGDAWKLVPGLTDAGYVFADDDASAVHVPDGVRVTLYEHKGASGHRMTLGPGLHNLAPHGFNDKVSSVRVEPLGRAQEEDGPPALALFRDVPPEGDAPPGDWNLALPPERSKLLFTAANGDFDHASISALRVPPGHEVMLFVQPDGSGFNLALGPGYHELAPAGFDDRTAAIRLSRLAER